MNRPLNKPCWVVFTHVGEPGPPSTRTRFYIESPAAAEHVREHGRGKLYSNYDGFFSAQRVEPFLSEEEAVAAALLVDGFVDKYEAGSQWPVSMKYRYHRFSPAKDEHSNGGYSYSDNDDKSWINLKDD